MVYQNPTAIQVIGANIQERQAMLYRQQIQQALGRELPPVGKSIIEVMDEIAVATAQATQVVTGQAQAVAEAQARAQTDPQKVFEKQLDLKNNNWLKKDEDIRDKEVN